MVIISEDSNEPPERPSRPSSTGSIGPDHCINPETANTTNTTTTNTANTTVATANDTAQANVLQGQEKASTGQQQEKPIESSVLGEKTQPRTSISSQSTSSSTVTSNPPPYLSGFSTLVGVDESG